MVVVEIRRRLQTGCQVGLRQSSTWGHASMGHVSRRGFVRRACCCCLLLLLHVAAAAAGGAAVAPGYTHALQSTRAYRPPEAKLSQTGKKQEVWSTPLSGKFGQSKASGKFSANRKQLSNLISTIFGSTIICLLNTSYDLDR